MTTTDLFESVEDERVSCPACGGRNRVDDGAAHCRLCGTVFRMLTFRPLVERVALEDGEGRCANHPGKSAVDVCVRCGGFVCDVCQTRTGESIYCPSCFELLHDRGELATTRSSRMRWDECAFGLSVIGLLPLCPWLISPTAFFMSLYGLVLLPKRPWMRFRPLILALVISLVTSLVWGGLVVGAFSE